MKPSQVDDAFEQMKNKIILGEWESNKVLSSNQIASELNMSRTPVEKALLRLETCELVDSIDGRYVVHPQNLEDIVELYQVREAMETQAIRIAFQNGLKDEEIRTLRDTVEKHKKAVGSEDDESFFGSGMELHRQILLMSGNKRFLKIHEQLQMQIERAQWLNVLMPDKDSSVEEHSSLITALETRNLAAAISALQEHSEKTISRYRKILTSERFCRAILEVSNIIKQDT
ncbi:MAG: GntR family transcriptional regulator [Lachnospiraceae bacterium]|nr:GntR family transcriptional regulator [Lachnospiraceae bacterium]